MSLSLKTSHHSPTLLVFDEFPKAGISRVSSPFHLSKSKNRSLNQNYSRSFCSISTDNNTTGLSDAATARLTLKVRQRRLKVIGKNRRHLRMLVQLVKVLKKLRRYGISGILSYGLLNTAYYLTTFLVVWCERDVFAFHAVGTVDKN